MAKTNKNISKIFTKNISYTMLKNVCRACGTLATYEKAERIFDDTNILWSIQVLTGLVLENAKTLPDIICCSCQTELQEAIRFSDRVIATQQNILAALSEDELQEVSVEYREAVMDLIGNCFQKDINTKKTESLSESTNINAHTSDEELVFKAGHEEADIVKEEYENQDDPMEFEIIIDDTPIIQDAENQNAVTIETAENLSDKQQFGLVKEEYEISNNKNCTISSSTAECAEVNKVIGNEIVLTSNIAKKKVGRKRLDTVLFFCEECGSHISGRMSYELHCKRHRGIKQHECDVCQYRFCTSSELKSHMRRHTGERPFACQYCDRSFSDYSTRVKHERTHTNERPYACHSCGKAFTTSYILKNHMLTHSGERAFSCEMCNKSFRRQTHLDSHFQSSSHKRKTASKQIKN